MLTEILNKLAYSYFPGSGENLYLITSISLRYLRNKDKKRCHK